MWYKKCLAELILPGKPGTSILKPKHKPGFHSILRHNDNITIPKIRKEGLLMSEARGHTYGEPDLIWGTTGKMYNADVPTVEFQISPEHLKSANIPSFGLHDEEEIEKYWENSNNYFALTKDIAPEDIKEIHEPWHDKARYMLENPDVLKHVQKNIHEFLQLPQEYSTAIRYLIEQRILKG
jgi:hypothetical protein